MTKLLMISGLSMFISFFSTPLANGQQQNSKPFWLDETKNEKNRLPMHASFAVYPNENEAMKDKWESSENNFSLNGPWKFKWFEKPADVPGDVASPDFKDSGWDNFKVPATWEVNNYGYPIYVNIGYEFSYLQKPCFCRYR